MRSRFIPWACAGVIALAWPALARAQKTISLSGGGPPKIAAVDPATRQGLPSVRDYRPPDGVGFKAADLFSEGVRLTAQWFWPVGTEDRKLPTVIMTHGWGATAANAREDAVELARAGYLVMLFDYRGWGESDGRVMLTGPRPSAGGAFTAPVRELRGYVDPWEQVEDWFNAISYAASDPRVDAGRIGLLGSDLSGGHVIYAAAHEPRIRAVVSEVSRLDSRPYKPYENDPARMIAEADAAASRLASGQGEYPPEGGRFANAVGGTHVGAPVGNKGMRWAPVELAFRVKAPALFILAQKEELFSNTNNGQQACERVLGPRKLMMLPNATHYDIYGEERMRAISAAIGWFDRYLKPAPAPGKASAGRNPPERGECNPPPEPPKGEEDKNGSGEGHKAQPTSGRFN